MTEETAIQKPPVARANIYATVLPDIRKRASEYGYAIGLHGSMQRDLDLIAVPWTEEAADAETLVEAIRAEVDGHVSNGYTFDGKAGELPATKPHGRLVWCIHFGFGGYIDLSVLPRQQERK